MEILDRMNKLQQMLLPLFIEGNASRNTNEISEYMLIFRRQSISFSTSKEVAHAVQTKNIIEERESLLFVKYVYKRAK